MELRDAHAKLRTTNEKLRREKERGERETRAQIRARRTDEEERRIGGVVDQVDMFMRLLPRVLTEKVSHLELPAAYKVSMCEDARYVKENPNKKLDCIFKFDLYKILK